MRAALATGALASPRGIADAALFLASDDSTSETPAILGVQDHTCVFFDAAHGRLCAVQRALGHDALPLACRQFPRVVASTTRAASASRSRTTVPRRPRPSLDAPGLTLGAHRPSIRPRSLLVLNTSDSMCAGALPPALRPDMLMDWESWWLWEGSSVDLLGNAGGSARGRARAPRCRRGRRHGLASR